MQCVNCKGSQSQSVRLSLQDLAEGKRYGLLRHGSCDCNTGCRRLALWTGPEPITTSPWLVKAYAKIRFGDEFNGPEVEVDFKQGVILDLLGCRTEVDVVIEEVDTALEVELPDIQLTFGALSSCCGAGAARGCATRTYRRLTAGEVPEMVIPIPPFAYAVQFAPVDPSAFFAAETIIAQRHNGYTMAVLTGAIVPDPWPIINGANNIIVVGASSETVFEPVFLIGV